MALGQLRKCGTMPYFDLLVTTHPEIGVHHHKFNQQAEQNKHNYRNETPHHSAVIADLLIPVVVHVLYQTPAQNISDSQIQSQIAVLNKDFRKLNADTFSSVPSVFRPLAADAKIEFCLATYDTAGNPTNGITRDTINALPSFGCGPMQRVAPWDPEHYLNIYVCPLPSNYLGYANFPAALASNPGCDGVVIDPKYFGTFNVTAPYNEGRTTTHEVGHWLDLMHIWGDDGNACTGSDFVSDTPNQADETYACPLVTPISCSNNPSGDMYMNFMDYTDDGCMGLFTLGQKDRMWQAIDSFRYELYNATGCGFVGIAEKPFLAQLNIYPNPASDVIQVNLPYGRMFEGSLLVYNAMGVLVSEANIPSAVNSTDFSVANLASGLYTIKIISNHQINFGRLSVTHR